MSKGISGLEEDVWITLCCQTGVYDFCELGKAYDYAGRDKLWKKLKEYEVKGKLLRPIQALYDGGMACVKVGQSELEIFNVCKGVRQGCTFSPWLLNVFYWQKW